MRSLALILIVVCFGCEPTLENVDGTNCTGTIPSTIRLVDYAEEHTLPCSVEEAQKMERATNADTFRENPPSVLCLLKESVISCTEFTNQDGTYYYRCETDHPAAPHDLTILPLVSTVNRGSNCPP